MALITIAACLGGRADRCEMDGQRITDALRVDLQMPDGRWHAFCSIECGRRWIEHRPDRPPKAAIVRDVLSGKPVDSYTAYFVQSSIVTNRANGNNIHAFQYRTDAAEHARRFQGKLIDDPFEAE